MNRLLPSKQRCRLTFLVALSLGVWAGCSASAPNPLFEAVDVGDLETTRAQLDAGASPNATDDQGWPLLSRAAAGGGTEIVRLLLDRGAKIERYDLSFATGSGNAETVALLLERGAQVDGLDVRGATALLVAANLPNPRITELLTAAGADLERRSDDGSTALILASRNGYTRTVEALLAAGAQLSATNAAGQTSLDWASARGHADLVDLLSKAGGQRGTAGDDPKSMQRAADAASARPLLVKTTSVGTTGSEAKIRVSVTNTYTERVSGVRYVISLLSPEGKVLATDRRESDVEIEPGERIMGRLDVRSVYIQGGGFFQVLAFPMRVGDHDVPEPAIER